MPLNFTQIKNSLVLGLGKSGRSASRVLREHFNIPVTVSDKKPFEELVNTEAMSRDDDLVFYREETLLNQLSYFDLVVKSPGISHDNMLVRACLDKGMKVIDEFELGYQLLLHRAVNPREQVIAITGTNGKTTTTELTAQLFRANNYAAIAAGNVGNPLSEKAMECNEYTIFVVEVSSFQLQFIDEFSPGVSVILNITPDHLDWHGSEAGYVKAKARIFANQSEGDYTVLNMDDDIVKNLHKKTKAKLRWFSKHEVYSNFCKAYQTGDAIVYWAGDGEAKIPLCEIALPGEHNRENILAACAACEPFSLNSENMNNVFRTFTGVAHRMEKVDEIEGVQFVNDSKGTNVEATLKAVDSFDDRLILIAGGKDKGADFHPIVKQVKEKAIKQVILLGETGEIIREQLNAAGYNQVILVKNMEQAVKKAYQKARPGDTILLSPACASWDMYPNFETRGDHFKDLVYALRGKSHES